MLWFLWISLLSSTQIYAKAFRPLVDLDWFEYNSTRPTGAPPTVQVIDSQGRPYTPPARKVPKFYFIRCKAGEKDLKTLDCHPECPDKFDNIDGTCVKECLSSYSRGRHGNKHTCRRDLVIWARKCKSPCTDFGPYWIDSGICHCRMDAETYYPEITEKIKNTRPGCFEGDKPIQLHGAKVCLNCLNHSYDKQCGGSGPGGQPVAGF
jgi:hypothetical protein